MIARRINGGTIDASWFNTIADEITNSEREYELEDEQVETLIDNQSFDGDLVSSVNFDYEIQRTGVFANGSFSLQYVAGTWRFADRGFVGEDHGVTFDVDQTDTTGILTVATDDKGAGTLKLKRRSFSV